MSNLLADIEALVQEHLPATEPYFLVAAKIKPTNNIKLYVDGDQGITIEKCIKLNRSLYKAIEEKAWFPEGEFSLEVSSPGIDEPLKQVRQYHKNVGRDIEITLTDDTVKAGIITEVNDDFCTINYTVGKGKKAEAVTAQVPYNTIKKAIIQIKF